MLKFFIFPVITLLMLDKVALIIVLTIAAFLQLEMMTAKASMYLLICYTIYMLPFS